MSEDVRQEESPRAQIKSRQRVADHGEVFTAEREVKAMCDLVKEETERIDSRFLEPACGDGNFLTEVLARKLATVQRLCGKSRPDYERDSITVLTSLYGIDILEDNVSACRERLFHRWKDTFTLLFRSPPDEELCRTAQEILRLNILCGDALKLKKVNADGVVTNEPILFAEWSFIGDQVKRRDFRLDVLIEMEEEETRPEEKTYGFFDEEPIGQNNWMTDPETGSQIPKPLREYPLIHYRKIPAIQ